MRNCPVCHSDKREELFSYTCTYGGEQIIFSCLECSMIYTSLIEVDYGNSMYSQPAALGSGIEDWDKDRLTQIAKEIKSYWKQQTSFSVLDIGCASGGLLDALRNENISDISGMDPSGVCVEQCQKKGHKAFKHCIDSCVFPHPTRMRYDQITMVHTLEHIANVDAALQGVLKYLAPNGTLYVEVPDAAHYMELPQLFSYFCMEHLNHFTADTLVDVLDRNGFSVDEPSYKVAKQQALGIDSPSIFCFAKRRKATRKVIMYVQMLQKELDDIDSKLVTQTFEGEEVIVWGAGELLGRIEKLPAMLKLRILQVVDSNRNLHPTR